MIRFVLFIVLLFINNNCCFGSNNNNNYRYYNNNNNINNDCIQNINSVSPIHPSEEGLLVLVQASLCQFNQIYSNSSSIIFIIDENNSINCTSIEIISTTTTTTTSTTNNETLIQCKFGSLPSTLNLESFNFNKLYSVEINLNKDQQLEQFIYSNYLFSNVKCTCDHGNCIYGLCMCDERYSGPTCSLKTLKYNDDSNPTGVSYNTFKLFLKDDEFQVSTNSFIQVQSQSPSQSPSKPDNNINDNSGSSSSSNNSNSNSKINNNLIINKLLINSMVINNDYTTDTYLSFDASKVLSNFISKLSYRANYYQSGQLTSFNIDSKNIFNSCGSLLSVSNNSVLVSVSINSQLSLTNIDQMNIEMVFTVTNKDQDLISELSNDKLSITIYNKETSSYITISMSDRYLSMGSISSNHAYFRLLDADELLSIYNISNSKSIYFSLGLPITSTTPTNFISEFVINGFNVEESLSTLKIIIIACSAFAFFCICALVIFIFIRLKNKNFTKGLQMEPYFQPLISNKDVDSDDDQDEFLLRH